MCSQLMKIKKLKKLRNTLLKIDSSVQLTLGRTELNCNRNCIQADRTETKVIIFLRTGPIPYALADISVGPNCFNIYIFTLLLILPGIEVIFFLDLFKVKS